MKKHFLLIFMLGLILVMGGCKDKNKEFVAGDKELIHLTSTPRGGVETYQIYTTNIMIYVDGTVRIYASDFVRWFGKEDIPELTVKLTQEEIQEIKDLIISEDLYNLRENVGNKDNIEGVIKHMTVYAADGSNTTGGISVSNRQFVRAYERIESMVREELYIYQAEIADVQYKGFVNYSNRNVQIMDREGFVILSQDNIENLEVVSEKTVETETFYVVLTFNEKGGDIIRDATMKATAEDPVVFSLSINGVFETNISVREALYEDKLYISRGTEEEAEALKDKIKSGMKY